MHTLTNMKDTKLFMLCFELANKIHTDDTRWDGSPYIAHPIRVALTVFDETKSEIAACKALLHDCFEDHPVEFETLIKTSEFSLIPKDIIDSSYILSKIDKDGTKLPLDVYLAKVKSDEHCRIIKICDIKDNIKTCSKSKALKYSEQLKFLQS